MNYELFSKIVGLTTIFSSEYKKNLLIESKDFSSWELKEIIEFIYSEEEKIYVDNETIIFNEYKEPIIKSKIQIQNIKKSGKYLNELLQLLKKNIKPWVLLLDLEKIAWEYIKDNNLKSSFKWVDNYKYNISVSINDKIFHHIPWKYILKKWDLVTIDSWINYKWWITDSAFTMIVWWYNKNYKAWNMLYVLKNTLDTHIKKFKPGYNMYDFSFDFYNDIISKGFNIIKNSSWHWVWNSLHEEPNIYNWPCEYMKNIILKPWMILAIEPLITWETRIAYTDKNNKWYTKKWDIWAYFEYTILITNNWYKIISWLKDIKIPKFSISYKTKKIKIWNKNYSLEIADTKEKQEFWLMFRDKIWENDWMLFEFKKSRKLNFTMNHTFLDLDILWLDKKWQIVFLKENCKNFFDVEYENTIEINKNVKSIIELNAWEIKLNLT